jgi:hypothetical protein
MVTRKKYWVIVFIHKYQYLFAKIAKLEKRPLSSYFSILVYNHAVFMKASVMLVSKFHIRRLVTYHSLHEICKAKG